MNNNTHKTTVTIEDIALPKGFAVAKKQGEVIFLPEGVPGDLVEIRIRKHKKQFSYGEIINIEKPSPWRTDPICPHFGRCGGCSLQNIKYDKQTTLKYNHLIYSLRKIGGIDIKDIDILPLIPSPQQFFYRNKMEFSFGQQNREIIIGLREKSSFFTGYTSEVISLDRCDIFSPLVNKIFPVFLNFAKEKSLTCYDRILKRGFLR
ncbi:MAG: class I SAM-dependent RNA methyltransferase, partial [Actinobacteria bacterium]|nr:class I SAM-dependent RNA methyltransferase [Actinomycetota bacterium]